MWKIIINPELLCDYAYQFKFVVDDPSDVDEIDQYLQRLPEIDSDSVMLMLQGTTREALAQVQAWLEPLCLQRGLRFCARKQVEWYGLGPGT